VTGYLSITAKKLLNANFESIIWLHTAPNLLRKIRKERAKLDSLRELTKVMFEAPPVGLEPATSGDVSRKLSFLSVFPLKYHTF
jgi:hypothetical protein